MNPTPNAFGPFHRRAPRRGPSRTPRAASRGSLRFGPRRLYPRRGPRLTSPETSLHDALGSNESHLKTLNQ